MNNQLLVTIKDNINKFKEDLGPRKTLLILSVSCLLLAVFIFISVYRPLIIKLGDADRQLNNLKAELITQRSNASILKEIDLKGRLLSQKEISLAIDEITEKGRSLGLKFISITPKEQQRVTPADFNKLPINFKIESGYQDLGQFLLYLEDFSRSTTGIEGLSFRPDKEAFPKLHIDLLVTLYMKAENADRKE